MTYGTGICTLPPVPKGDSDIPTRTRPKPIQRPRLDEDGVPITEYRRTLAECCARTARTHRPVVVTQNGRATNVMLGAADFESIRDEIERIRARKELPRHVEISRREFAEVKFVTEAEAFEESERMLDCLYAKRTKSS